MESRKSVKRTTLTDVANLAAVSVQTASHVLSGNRRVRVAQATRERVEAAAKTLGYNPNRIARAMKTGKTGTLSLWMPVDRPVINYLRILNVVSRRASATGHGLVVVGLSSNVAYGLERKLPDPWPTDGMICYDCGRAIRVFRERPENAAVPIVIIGTEEFEGADTITWDVRGASFDLTRALIQGGAKKVVHLTPQWVLDDYPDEQRQRGYREAMQFAGLEPVFVGASSEMRRDAETAFHDHIARSGAPDAVTAFTDTMGLGAVEALHRAGVLVPDDCAVWGYGDSPEAETSAVPLSTLRIPVYEMGYQACAWILERIADRSLESRKIVFPLERIERGSSRPM